MEQATELQWLLVGQTDAAQGDVQNLAFHAVQAVTLQADAGGDLGADELALIDRFVNNVYR